MLSEKPTAVRCRRSTFLPIGEKKLLNTFTPSGGGTEHGDWFPPKSKQLCSKQPIMRTEDRLFDRGWVRSAMITRKCGNIYFPKYFMAVRPFLTRNCFQELFGLKG